MLTLLSYRILKLTRFGYVLSICGHVQSSCPKLRGTLIVPRHCAQQPFAPGVLFQLRLEFVHTPFANLAELIRVQVFIKVDDLAVGGVHQHIGNLAHEVSLGEGEKRGLEGSGLPSSKGTFAWAYENR